MKFYTWDIVVVPPTEGFLFTQMLELLDFSIEDDNPFFLVVLYAIALVEVDYNLINC